MTARGTTQEEDPEEPRQSGSPVGPHDRVVIDTNIFVGAGFSPDSASGRIVRAVRERRLGMPWTVATREEVETVLRKIPPLSWSDAEGLFREEDRLEGSLSHEGLEWVPDPTDRKFAALARCTGATLVSNDRHLLDGRARAGFPILTSGEFRDRML